MAPQYTTKDLVYYSGLFLGLATTYVLLESMGVSNQIVKLLAGLAVGVGCGWLLEKVYSDNKD